MVTIEVCVGSACYVKGSYNVISELQDLIADNGMEDKATVKAAFCLGNCAHSVSARFEGEETVYSVPPKEVKAFFKDEVMKRA